MRDASRPTYLFVIGQYGHMGGAERQAVHFMQYLLDRGGVNIAVLGWSKEGSLSARLEAMGCAIYTFPYKLVNSRGLRLLNLAKLAMFIRFKIRPSKILPFVSINSRPICEIWRFTGADFAWWNQQDEGRRMFGTSAEKRALVNASVITSNSLAGTEFISQTYGIPESEVRTYNNGTPIPDVYALDLQWRKKLGISQEDLLVSMVANITPYKDHATLLRAWKIVLDELNDANIPLPTLALAGFTKRKRHVNKLKIMAFDLGLGNTVKFLGAIDSTNELMYESNLVVHSSQTEGCPNAVCEAMALSRPVVGTDIPGMRQVFKERDWGRCLSAPESESQLAVNIVRLLKNRKLAEQLGMENKTRMIEDFSIAGMCQLFAEIVEQ